MKKLLSFIVALFFASLSYEASGQALVRGAVLELDSITPIMGATVTFSGINTDSVPVTYEFTTDISGRFMEYVDLGMYWVTACAEGYDCSSLADSLLVAGETLNVETDSLLVVYNAQTGVYDAALLVYDALTNHYDTVMMAVNNVTGINFVLHETY